MNQQWLQTDLRHYCPNSTHHLISKKTSNNIIHKEEHYQTDMRLFVKSHKKKKTKNPFNILTKDIRIESKHQKSTKIPPPPRCPLSPPPLHYLQSF
tara:strand:- start:139 stop:426 length:288 start_codon:yes stop_codon:yes gene_type:complete